MRFIIVIVLMFLAGASIAQSKKIKKDQRGQQNPTSVNPGYPNVSSESKKTKKTPSKGPTYELEEQYYARVAKLEKARKKTEKMLASPQYSDPLYFGHKRPPKKRKPGKMKFCKECGIRH